MNREDFLVLTQYLVAKPREVKVVEIDRESVAYLREKYGNDAKGKKKESLEETSPDDDWIISADFLRMDLNEVFKGRSFVLTGNYPYDISSQIFFKMLDNRDLIPCCTGMIQHYGILSVLMQAWYDVEYLFTVDETVFNPPPKVKSAVIRMTRNDVTDLGCDWQLFRRIVKTVFNQRRKMLRVSLRQLFSDRQPAAGFYDHEIMTKRPEQLPIAQFVELTNLVAAEL